jgi:RNA polymerase sigma-70 factor (ECF subfamily)
MIWEGTLDQSDDLIAQAKSGDRGAFDALLRPLIAPGFRLAFTMLRDWQEAEDAVQEASLKAWRRLGQVRAETGSVQPWFLAIVANQCRSAKRLRWFSVLKSDALPSGLRQKEEGLAESEDLRRALKRLSPEHRAVLFLYYGLDLPLEEVAIALGVGRAGAKARLYRALDKLRPELDVVEERPR